MRVWAGIVLALVAGPGCRPKEETLTVPPLTLEPANRLTLAAEIEFGPEWSPMIVEENGNIRWMARHATLRVRNRRWSTMALHLCGFTSISHFTTAILVDTSAGGKVVDHRELIHDDFDWVMRVGPENRDPDADWFTITIDANQTFTPDGGVGGERSLALTVLRWEVE